MTNHATGFERPDHGRRDIRGATDGRRVTECLGGFLHRRDDLSLDGRRRIGGVHTNARECARAGDRPGPRPKILRAARAPKAFLDVGVDVLPSNFLPGAFCILEREDATPARFQQRAHDGRDSPIPELVRVALAAFAIETQAHQRSAHFDMARAQRRDAEAAVFAYIFLAARPQETDRENAQHAGQHAFPTVILPSEVARYLCPELGELASEGDQPAVLAPLPPGDGALVIQVLPATGLVLADGLDPSVLLHIDGNTPPRRWDSQRADAIQLASPACPTTGESISETGLHSSVSEDAVRSQVGYYGHFVASNVLPDASGAVPAGTH